MGCLHIGAKEARLDLVRAALEEVRSLGGKLFLIGDLINNGQWVGTRHMGTTWDDVATPRVQVSAAKALLGRYAKIIVGIIGGNHAARTEKATSFNPEEEIANWLGVPYREPIHQELFAGKRVALGHGVGKSDFQKVLQYYSHSDVIALGHTHQLYSEVIRRHTPSGMKNTWLVRTGNFLDQPMYGKRALYPPTPLGFSMVVVRGEGLVVITRAMP